MLTKPIKDDMIYYDLDEVIRKLNYFGTFPKWDSKYKGKSLIDSVNANLNILREAPTTEYFNVIRKQSPIVILTHQQPGWLDFTFEWLDEHFSPGEVCSIHVTNSSEAKLGYLAEGDFLVDDNPTFSDYSKIILIDQPYNSKVRCPRRVTTPAELLKQIKLCQE